MRLFALIFLFCLALPALAQDSPATSETEEEPASRDGSQATGIVSAPLESPFLQDDLELIVGNVQRPNGLVWFEHHLYTVCNGDWTVYRINDQTAETITLVFGTRDGNSLLAEATEAGFDLWVPDSDTGTLWKIDQKREAPRSVTDGLESPWGIARLDGDRFLITDSRLNTILEVSESGASREAQSQLRAPTGIARAGDYIYFANGGSARRGVEYFEIGADGTYSDVKPLVSGLQNTSNIALGADGFLYFAYALGTRGVVGRVNPELCRESGCGNDEVEMVVFSDVPAPLAIALSDDLRLFLHSRYRPEIYWAQLPVEASA